MRPHTFAPLPLVTLLATLVAGTGGLALAQEATPLEGSELAVDWPPQGERLRELAAFQDIDIGFASRIDWFSLPQAPIYGDIAAAEFDILTPESSFKWFYLRPDENTFDFTDVDAQVAFAEANGMRLHGHPLTWYLLNPAWLDAVPPERLPEVLENHVRTVVSRYAGRFDVWDVVNEGLNDDGSGLRDDVWTRGFGGTGYMDIAFRTAREADPGATLIYNDYDIGWLTPKSARALALVDELKGRGVPVDGIGMQMHLDHTFIHFEGISEAMQRFADRDLDVYVTELDVAVLAVGDYDVQADVYEEVIRRCLMQPRCEAVQIWGVDDFYSWQPYFRPLPFDADFRVKPAYFGMQRGLMTRPVHPELCALEGARVVSGTVYSDAADGAAGADGSGNAFGMRCEDVALGGGFTSLAIRYRNPGTEAPTLTVAAGDAVIAAVPLSPTIDSNDGDFTTVEVRVPPLDGTTTLALSVGAVSDGTSVGVDALLFGDPTRSPTTSGSTDGSGSGGGTTAGGATTGGTTVGGVTGGGATGGTTSGGGSTAGGSSGGGGFGAADPLWLGALTPWLLLVARRRQRRVFAARPAISRTSVGTR